VGRLDRYTSCRVLTARWQSGFEVERVANGSKRGAGALVFPNETTTTEAKKATTTCCFSCIILCWLADTSWGYAFEVVRPGEMF
jgi:hypothetical protein